MRHTYRYKNNFDYWTERWSDLDVDNVMSNKDVYPLKFAEKLIPENTLNSILEAGCGNGRILKYYHDKGYDIHGIDFIEEAISKLRQSDDSLKVDKMSIFDTQFESNKFEYILAFGLFHNFEDKTINALIETNRILSPTGKLCASFRADNLQNKIIDFLYLKRYKGKKSKMHYHKTNFTKSDIKVLMNMADFNVLEIESAVNMSFLFKFKFFRTKRQFEFDENVGRSQGYKLNKLGSIVNKILLFFLRDQFCNVYVVYAGKNL